MARRKPNPRTQATRAALLRVAGDMNRDQGLSYVQACRNRGVNPASRKTHLKALFYKDASGRIRPHKSDGYVQKVSIPSPKPGVRITFKARGSKERKLVGEWQAAINEAGRGNFGRIRNFPPGTVIDGVRLPTGAHEVQRILEAMENSESPFEQLYATAGAA